MITLTAVDFEMQYDSTHRYSFTETENGTCIAFGHRDRVAFAAEVTAYDQYCGCWIDEADNTNAKDVHHVYAVHLNPERERDEWQISRRNVTPDTPGAFPVTVVDR